MSEILVVHPGKNLLKVVADHLLERRHLSQAVVIFPHRRPAAFLEYYLAQKIDKPCLLPHIRAFEDWVRETFVALEEGPKTILDDYDQAWLAYLAAREVFQEDGEDIAAFEEFFPWALRLAKLFKEFDLELAKAKDLYYPPAESLPKRAVKLLERLGRIYEKFNAKLVKGHFTTPARMLRFLAEEDFPLPEAPVYLVGFYALTRAEDRLFRKLYENGAFIYWQAEVENLPELYERWRREWQAELKEIRPEKSQEPELFFFEAHDLHAELKELAQRLPEKITDTRPDACAVVLLSTGSLIPLTHFLPEGPVNLTMGYPLRFTGLFTFLESLFALVLGKDEGRGYHLRELLEFLKSPYLAGTYDLEKRLREYGAPFITKEKLFDLVKGLSDEKMRCGDRQNLQFCLSLLDRVKHLFEEMITPLEEAQTPADLSRALRRIFRFIRPRETFGVFEREFLTAILETVLPVLENSLFSRVWMERRGLFRLFEELVTSVQVPFEGEPLCGLQVMGLLETRLLSFDEVFFLDVNEGVLPDVEEVNPLLPQEVRQALGLPDRQRDESILRYHFERLLHTAKKVHLFWQFQTTKAGEAGFEGKKIRSRYVEKLIWEIEKREGKLFSESREAHRLKSSSLEILPEGLSRPEPLRKDESLKEMIKSKLSEISPSLLEIYLDCPLKFFYSKVLALSSPQVPDELDHTQLGIAVHEALEEFFRKTTGNSFPATVRQAALNFERLFELFKEKLEKKEFYRILSPEKKFLLLKGAEFRLKQYLENHPKETCIVALEESYSLPFEVPGIRKLELFGKMDRIDRRNDVYVVLDYKTGKVEDVKATKALELDVSPWLSEKRLDDEALREILDRLPDVQLPFYVYLFVRAAQSVTNPPVEWSKTTAAYIKLREKGQEVYFIKPSVLEKEAEPYAKWFEEKFPELIKYLIMHIIESPYWYPAINDSACGYCDYWKMCRYGV